MEQVRSSRIPELDGLRAIAILLVMVNHFIPWAFRSCQPSDRFMNHLAAQCGIGVDLFFVLSGFLITGILVDAKGTPDYFRRFFLRRSLRIFPVYYAFLIPVSLCMGTLFSGIGRSWFLLYLRNWRGPDEVSDGILGHLWSLAVEEQFYVIWAIVVFFCSLKTLWRFSLCLIVAGPLIRATLHHFDVPGYLIFRLTPARMDALVIGGVVSLALRRGTNLIPIAWAGAIIGLAGLLLLSPDINQPLTQAFRPSASCILFASCLALSASGTKLLRHPILAQIARYSYALYVFHLLLGVWIFSFAASVGLPGRSVALPLAALGVYAAAACSWKLIEEPMLRVRDHLERNAVDSIPCSPADHPSSSASSCFGVYAADFSDDPQNAVPRT